MSHDTAPLPDHTRTASCRLEAEEVSSSDHLIKRGWIGFSSLRFLSNAHSFSLTPCSRAALMKQLTLTWIFLAGFVEDMGWNHKRFKLNIAETRCTLSEFTGDSPKEVSPRVLLAAGRADAVIVNGGLGPPAPPALPPTSPKRRSASQCRWSAAVPPKDVRRRGRVIE